MDSELILCGATMHADAMQPPENALEIQLNAAHSAGFSGIALWSYHHHLSCVAGLSVTEIEKKIQSSGLSVPVVEAILPWDASSDAEAIQLAEPVFALAHSLGARYVVAVSLATTTEQITDASRLGAICEVAQSYNLGIAVEFLPWSGIASLASAWRLVQQSNCENASIMLDAWHWQRQPGGPCPELLSTLPAKCISIYQICDASAQPNGAAEEECMRERLLPGGGVVNFASLHQSLDSIGAKPVLAAEVFNRQRVSAGAQQFARDVYSATCSVLTLNRS